MKFKEILPKYFLSKGIDTFFFLQGGMITGIIDELNKCSNIKLISMYHEQAAAFAIDGYGRVNNKPAVAMGTSGPGATNLITGIGSCYYDSVPSIFITGQVNTNEQKGSKATRQIGFQETDIVSIIKPITKYAVMIDEKSNIIQILDDAYDIAMSGRPGPVLIDIPFNMQNFEIDFVDTKTTTNDILNETGNTAEINNFIDQLEIILKEAKSPLILAGRGIRSSNSIELFRAFINKWKIPVVTSLLGLDALSYDDPHRIGFIGTYGNRWANYALGKSDFILVLGSRLDIRQTGVDTEGFIKNKKVFHVDIDEAELNNRIKANYTLKAHLADFFQTILYRKPVEKNFSEWINYIRNNQQKMLDINELKKIKGINPNIFIHQLSNASREASTIVADVGNHQMWVAQSYEILSHQKLITSGGMGSMGYAVPAAIGAFYSNSLDPVLVISGDGGFQINIQELQTIVRENLPIKIVLLNNSSLGMIRQFQDSYYNSVYTSTVDGKGYKNPDFIKIANAYGIDSFRIENNNQINEGLRKLWEFPCRPFLLEVNIHVYTNLYPKMLFGSPLTKMEGEL